MKKLWRSGMIDKKVVAEREDSVKGSPTFKFHEWIRNRKPYDRYDADVAFDKKTFGDNEEK